MTVEDFLGKIDWEGNEYALTEMHSEEMPDEEGTALLAKVQEDVKEFYAYIDKLYEE